MKELLLKLKKKENLSFEESKFAFESIMSGKVKEDQIQTKRLWTTDEIDF